MDESACHASQSANLKEEELFMRTVVLICAFFSTTAQAELFGLPNAGLAAMQSDSKISVEAAFTSGQIASEDYSNLGVRASYHLTENITLFGDLGRGELQNDGQVTFGAGGAIDLGPIFEFSQSFAVKASAHRFEISNFSSFVPVGCIDSSLSGEFGFTFCSFGGSSTSTESVIALSAEMLVKGKPIQLLANLDLRPSWYANLGIHTFDDSIMDTTAGVGAGLIFPFNKNNFYIAADMIDSLAFSIGGQFIIC